MIAQRSVLDDVVNTCRSCADRFGPFDGIPTPTGWRATSCSQRRQVLLLDSFCFHVVELLGEVRRLCTVDRLDLEAQG